METFRSRSVAALWLAALLIGLINGLADARRVVVMTRPRPHDPGVEAAIGAGRWLSDGTVTDAGGAAPSRRMLVLRHGDEGAPWFTYRMNYGKPQD